MRSQSIFYTFSLLIILFHFACSSENVDELNIEGTEVVVSFNPTGEISLESESTLGGRNEGDLGIVYGVKIYRIVDNNAVYYVSGIFDSLDEMNISLFSDEQYRVDFSAIKNGTSLGLVHAYQEDIVIIQNLFSQNNVPVTNSFNEEGSQGFYLKSNSAAVHTTRGIIDWTSSTSLVDRFDGSAIINNPTEEDTIVHILLRRTSFGMAIKVENIDENDTLNITLYSAPGTPYNYQLTHSNDIEYQIRTLENDGFDLDDQHEVSLYSSFELKVYDSTGSYVRDKLLSTQTLRGKRNVKRTYVIDLLDFDSGTSGRGSFELDYLDDEMIDEGEIRIGG